MATKIAPIQQINATELSQTDNSVAFICWIGDLIPIGWFGIRFNVCLEWNKGITLRETVSVTIPVNDRNLLKEIARKFGWACML